MNRFWIYVWLLILLCSGDVLAQGFSTIVAERCRTDLWNLNQIMGWQTQWPRQAENAPLDTPHQRRSLMERWEQIPSVLEQEEQTLRKGLREGFSAPKPVVRRVEAQITSLLDLEDDESPLWSPARRSESETFRQEWDGLVRQEVIPALDRFRKFLAETYLPEAREEIGLNAVPAGSICYENTVERWTTLRIPAEELKRIGEKHMTVLHQRLDDLARAEFDLSGDELLRRFRTQPLPEAFSTGEEVVSHAQAAIARVKEVLPQWFNGLGNMDVVVQPMLPHQASGAPAGIYQPASGPEQPGIYLINTSRPEQRRLMSEAIAFHETLPGHHLQMRYRRGNDTYNAGYGEGWAIYAEHLVDEMSLYSGPLDRAGMIVKHMWATSRLVVDPGIHVYGWTREEAIHYMQTHTALSREEIEVELDRYIALPGQSLGYMLGYLEMKKLRDLAEESLGEEFDIKEFHDVLLGDGIVTLPQLGQNVRSWLATREVDLVIHNASVFNSKTRQVEMNRSVVVQDGLVIDILDAESDAVPLAKRVVEAKGRLLTPGFIDVHHHTSLVLADSFNSTGGSIANLSMDPDSIAAYRKTFAEAYLPYGVTTVREAGGDTRFMPLMQKWMEPVHWAPDFFASGGALVSHEDGRVPFAGHDVVSDPADAARTVREYEVSGMQHIKLYWRLRRPEFEAALREARLLGLTAFGHIDYKIVSVREALELGLGNFEHAYTLGVEVLDLDENRKVWQRTRDDILNGDLRGAFFMGIMELFNELGKDDPRLLTLIDQLSKANASVTPTLHIFAAPLGLTWFEPILPGEFADTSGWSRDQMTKAREGYDVLESYVRHLHEAGVLLALGTDSAEPGKAALSEMLLLHEAGIPMSDVLQIATLNSATVLGLQSSHGTIEPGKRAHLVLFDSDPLQFPQALLERKTVFKDGVEVIQRR